MYRVSDNDFGKARGRNPSKSYILVRRRGFRLITQSKIFIWKAIDAPTFTLCPRVYNESFFGSGIAKTPVK